MRNRSLACLMIAICTAGSRAAQQVDPSKGLTLANRYVRLELEPNGMGLSALVDLASGANHIQPVKEKHRLWQVSMGRGRQIETISNNYAPCNYAQLENPPGGGQRAVLEWNDLKWWHEDRVLSVRVTIDLPPGSGIAQWRISVSNRSNYWGLWSLAFPDVSGLPEPGKYDLARPAFGSGGQLLRAFRGKIQARYPDGSWPMQFLALTRSRDSIYFATMDSEARAKDFVVDPGESAISIVHYPDNMGVTGSDYAGYYPVEFGVYQGGWLEAAERYRRWALEQKWAQGGKLSQRADVPDILKNVGVWLMDDWVWSGAQGSPQEMNKPLIEAQKWLGVPVCPALVQLASPGVRQ